MLWNEMATILQTIFSYTFYLLLQFCLIFVPINPIGSKSALVHILAWHQPGNRPLPEPRLIHVTETLHLVSVRMSFKVHQLLLIAAHCRDFSVSKQSGDCIKLPKYSAQIIQHNISHTLYHLRCTWQIHIWSGQNCLQMGTFLRQHWC